MAKVVQSVVELLLPLVLSTTERTHNTVRSPALRSPEGAIFLAFEDIAASR